MNESPASPLSKERGESGFRWGRSSVFFRDDEVHTVDLLVRSHELDATLAVGPGDSRHGASRTVSLVTVTHLFLNLCERRKLALGRTLGRHIDSRSSLSHKSLRGTCGRDLCKLLGRQSGNKFRRRSSLVQGLEGRFGWRRLGRSGIHGERILLLCRRDWHLETVLGRSSSGD
jgi:hypothetical protein